MNTQLTPKEILDQAASSGTRLIIKDNFRRMSGTIVKGMIGGYGVYYSKQTKKAHFINPNYLDSIQYIKTSYNRKTVFKK